MHEHKDVDAVAPRQTTLKSQPHQSFAALDDGPGLVAPPHLFTQAVRCHQAGDLVAAESLYRQIILAEPGHAEAWSNLGLALTSGGRHDEAVQACATAIAVRSDFADAYLNLITALSALGEIERSVTVYRCAIALLPGRSDVGANLGLVLEALGRPGEALDAYRGVLAFQPDHAVSCLAAARLLGAVGRNEEAAAVLEAGIVARPDFVEAWCNLGPVLAGLGRFAEAAAAGDHAFALLPGNAEIACNHGVVLQQAGRTLEAVEAYRRAIALDPAFPSPRANLGVALQELLRFDEAVDAFEGAIALKPDFDTAVVEAIKVRRHICDWSRFEADESALQDILTSGRDAIFMLLLMSFAATPAQLLRCAQMSMRRLNAIEPRPLPAPGPRTGRLKVGYLSHDFREHPVGRLMPELLRGHDRGAVEVFAYAIGPDDAGPVRTAVRAAVEHFIDLHPVSDREAAARIAADGIDVLVDLTGPTLGARLAIVAQRPAPVQVSFLGWPATMGLDAIDYVVADGFLVRPGEEAAYTERVVRLPHCYQPSDGARGAPTVPVSRAECGLPAKGVVFCSFNNTSKITPDMFDLWMRVLGRVPGSVLWLYCKTPQTIVNLQTRAAAAGIAPERLVFAGFAGTDLYLSRFALADLFLDSLPYNAGATCNDALWAGLPVLTCAGDTYVGRMAGSMLTTLGLPELVTQSPEAYEEAAVRLATKPRVLKALRKRLAAAKVSTPMFDMSRYARHLEQAFTAMDTRRREGLAPDHITVEADPA